MRRFTLQIVLAAFIFSCGGQWYVLQGVAWANMIRDYSASMPLSQAVQMTFSGDYPCPVCKALAERKKAEGSSLASITKQETKLLAPLLEIPGRFGAIATQSFPAFQSSWRTRSEPPPLPPPRIA